MKKNQIDNNKSRSILLTVLWGGMASILGLIINMMITPLVTNRLGTEAFGYVSLANNFITYVTILTAALNSYATRYISLEYHKDDINKSKQYFNSVLFANIVGGIAILLVLVGVIIKLEYIIIIPTDLVSDVKLLFAFMFLNFFTLLIGNTFLVSAYIKEKLDIANMFKAVGYIAQIVLLFFSYKIFQPKVWYVGLGYCVSSVLIVVGAYWLYKRVTPELVVDVKFYSFSSVKVLVVNGIWYSINSLGNVLNSGLDLIITNLMLTPRIMGELSIAKTLGGIVCALYQIVSQAFQPMLLKSYAQGNIEKLMVQLRIAMKASGVVSGLFFVEFVVLGKMFYQLWIPNQNIDFIYNLTIITLASYLLEGVVGPLYYIYTLTVKNRFPCVITIVGGILNVVMMLALIKNTNLGGYAVVGTTTVIMIFINLVTNPVYMAKCLKIKWHTFYPTILRFITYIIIVIPVVNLILYNRTVQTWGNLIVNGAIVSLTGLVFYSIIVLNGEERNWLIKSMISKINNLRGTK